MLSSEDLQKRLSLSVCVCHRESESIARARAPSLSLALSFSLSLSPPIISQRLEGAEPRRRHCNAIAARLKKRRSLTHTLHTHLTVSGDEHTPAFGEELRLHGASTTTQRDTTQQRAGHDLWVFLGNARAQRKTLAPR